MIAARKRAETLARMRNLAQSAAASRTGGASSADDAARCDICNTTVPDDHRHLLHLVDRRIVCTCEACWGAVFRQRGVPPDCNAHAVAGPLPV